MQISTLRKSIYNLLRIHDGEITDDGPKSVGFFPLSLAEFEESFQENRIKILRELQVLNPPLSVELKTDLINLIVNCKIKLESKQEEIHSYKNQVLDAMLIEKLKFSKELIELFSQNSIDSCPLLKTAPKINFAFTQRELVNLFDTFRKVGLISNSEIDIKKSLVENSTFLDKGKNINITLESLKNEFSRIKTGNGINKAKSIDSLIHKLEEVINSLMQDKINEEKQYEAHLGKNKKQ